MRIAMFTNNYKPYIGGVPVSVEHLAKALRELGHKVYIFAPSYKNQVEEEYVIRYPSFPIKIAGAPIPDVLTKIFERKVLELQIDVIHVHHPALVGNIALRLRKKYGIPVIFTYHTRYEEYLHYVKPLETIEKHTGMLEWYLNYFCNRCDLIIAPTDGIKKYLQEKQINAPIGVLPTGLPKRNFEADADKVRAIKKKYGEDADYLFASVSRLAEEKNLDFQLEGLKILKEKLAGRGKTFRYLLIGEGPKRAALQQNIRRMKLEKEIILVGNVPNEEVVSYLNASELFLFSSKSETQGIVILEAMAAERPVVAVKASGVEDLVKDGVNGFLTTENPVEWAEKINLLTEDENRRNEMSSQAVLTAFQYSEEEVASRAAEYYFSTWIRCREEIQKVLLNQRYVV